MFQATEMQMCVSRLMMPAVHACVISSLVRSWYASKSTFECSPWYGLCGPIARGSLDQKKAWLAQMWEYLTHKLLGQGYACN